LLCSKDGVSALLRLRDEIQAGAQLEAAAGAAVHTPAESLLPSLRFIGRAGLSRVDHFGLIGTAKSVSDRRALDGQRRCQFCNATFSSGFLDRVLLSVHGAI